MLSLKLDLIFNQRSNILQTTYDQSGYIKDWISELSFDVNRIFLKYLEDTHGIDTNPESGSFSFDLYCNAEQGANGEYFSDDIGTRVIVRRIFNSNATL